MTAEDRDVCRRITTRGVPCRSHDLRQPIERERDSIDVKFAR